MENAGYRVRTNLRLSPPTIQPIGFNMPIYVYQYLDDKGQPTDEPTFELVQQMSEDALTEHEGRPVQRVIQAPNIAGKWSDMKGKSQLSNENLDRLGFTKYEKRGDGYMERTAGKEGPKSISLDD